jgi:hypothetical protein
MLDANDILSGLGQDHFNEVMKLQDIKPEKNMVRIEEVSNSGATAQTESQAKKAPMTPKK